MRWPCPILLVLAGNLAAADPCPKGAPSLVVDTDAHVLRLCAAGAVVKSYDVAIGKGGVGKRVQGDKKTPLGWYPLGEPGASPKFDLFIPVGYPTEEQAKAGFTGGAIGVHGPSRRLAWLGRLSVAADWTLGCVAVASDAEIEEIAAWVTRARAGWIELR